MTNLKDIINLVVEYNNKHFSKKKVDPSYISKVITDNPDYLHIDESIEDKDELMAIVEIRMKKIIKCAIQLQEERESLDNFGVDKNGNIVELKN